MTYRRTETETGKSWTIHLLLQPAVSGVTVDLLVSAKLAVDILSTFCDGRMVQRAKLMLSKFLHL